MIFPKKLKKGMHIRVIAPSNTFKIISDDVREIAKERFAELGLSVSYAQNAEDNSSVAARVKDLHDAFADKSVDAIFTAIGGFSSHQIIDKIDYDIIKNNPKLFCGFSDITALSNAINAKTGLVTYYGPHFSTLGMLKGIEYTMEYLKKCLMEEDAFDIKSSAEWSDDLWFLDQEKREFIKNEGCWLINEGQAQGRLMGGNLSTLRLLFGTEFMPDIKDAILFIEDAGGTNKTEFERGLQSLIHQKDFKTVKALVIGRFQKSSQVIRQDLEKMISTKETLNNLPIIANVDFGHTTPMITFPLGGEVSINKAEIKVIKH